MEPSDSGERGRDRARARLGTAPEKGAPPMLDGTEAVAVAMVSGFFWMVVLPLWLHTTFEATAETMIIRYPVLE